MLGKYISQLPDIAQEWVSTRHEHEHTDLNFQNIQGPYQMSSKANTVSFASPPFFRTPYIFHTFTFIHPPQNLPMIMEFLGN